MVNLQENENRVTPLSSFTSTIETKILYRPQHKHLDTYYHHKLSGSANKKCLASSPEWFDTGGSGKKHLIYEKKHLVYENNLSTDTIICI